MWWCFVCAGLQPSICPHRTNWILPLLRCLLHKFYRTRNVWTTRNTFVIDAPQSGLKGLSQTLSLNYQDALWRPGVKLHPRGQGPLRVQRVGLKTREVCQMHWLEYNQTCAIRLVSLLTSLIVTEHKYPLRYAKPFSITPFIDLPLLSLALASNTNLKLVVSLVWFTTRK